VSASKSNQLLGSIVHKIRKGTVNMKVKCANCSGSHKADSRECKAKEEAIQRAIQERQIWREKRKEQHNRKSLEKKDETK
jgi:hypothetical protein